LIETLLIAASMHLLGKLRAVQILDIVDLSLPLLVNKSSRSNTALQLTDHLDKLSQLLVFECKVLLLQLVMLLDECLGPK
jgi:hypothetical protein